MLVKRSTPLMRSRQAIMEKMEELKQIRDASREVESESLRLHRQNVDSQIRALYWVLGYDLGARYWCTHCSLSHSGIKCPQCGGERISDAERELGENLIEIEVCKPKIESSCSRKQLGKG